MAIPAAAGIFILLDQIATKFYWFMMNPWSRKVSIMAVFTTGWLLGYALLFAGAIAIRATINNFIPETLQAPLRLIVYHMPSNLQFNLSLLMALGVASWAWSKKEQWMSTAAQAN